MAGGDITAVGPGRTDGIAVIGAGQHGRVVASVIEAAGLIVSGLYDDAPESWGSQVGSWSVVGPPSALPAGAPAVMGVGDNAARKELAERVDAQWTTVIHPFSWIDPGVRIGPGTVVCAGSIAQVGAQIGEHAILNNRSGVGHDVQLGDYAHITVAHLGGGATVGEGAFLGIGSVVLPRVRVGAWATVGAGAVVTVDVDPGTTVMGNPAKQHDRGTAGADKGVKYSSSRPR